MPENPSFCPESQLTQEWQLLLKLLSMPPNGDQTSPGPKPPKSQPRERPHDHLEQAVIPEINPGVCHHGRQDCQATGFGRGQHALEVGPVETVQPEMRYDVGCQTVRHSLGVAAGHAICVTHSQQSTPVQRAHFGPLLAAQYLQGQQGLLNAAGR